MTNYHVVRDQPSIVLHAGNGQTADGQLAEMDEASDLAAVAIDATWPVVNLGGAVSIGKPVQFRAFDAGMRFRKYFGHVASAYAQQGGAGGYFATGRSVPGNSGGGVYSQGKLVGVVWGSPAGGTAFVPIGPVRRLIDRACRRWTRQSSVPPRQSTPKSGDSGCQDSPTPQPCDCHDRWDRLQQQIAQLQSRQPASPPNVFAFDWLKLAAAALGFSGPIGVAIVAAGWLLGARRQRGVGGPRDDGFRRREEAS